AIAGILIYTLQVAGQTENLPKTSAGFPINYKEDSVGNYVLPDPLITTKGKRITTAKEWLTIRRPELLHLFEFYQFGRMPPPSRMIADVFEKGTPALNGLAIRKQVTVYLTGDSMHKVDLLMYLPANKKRVPLILTVSFASNYQLSGDSNVRIGYTWTREGKKISGGQPGRFGKMDIEQFIREGIGFATIYYGDIEPDFKTGYKEGIRGYYLGQQQTFSDEQWGAISAWSWGLSRVMDYLETDPHVDSKRVALQGASRLGKTALWTGAYDERFKVIIASISGEGGAALSRRNYGENIKHITDTSRYYYQFARNYHSFASKVDSLPFDAHMLVALVAPRALLLQTGDSDYWSDPRGEFLSAIAAEPVYKLFNEKGPGTSIIPAAGDTSLAMNKLGYYMHKGGHTVLPEDWKLFIEFMKKYL
ncbi:MAG TPA: hypothetical protein VHM26_14525, partial [Chitinophagaceae bacterium]|nr:hypothetical protein [Chitinophagaceae bacterium]